MTAAPIRPMCFIAMPFGKRTATSLGEIDFDQIHSFIQQGAEDAGLEAIRADFEPGGGFIHKPMLERLLVAEYVIADVTQANPNVMYEVGVRHGASSRATLLICADKFVPNLPFDFKPFRVLPYAIDADGQITDVSGRKLAAVLSSRLREARSGTLPVDNPIMQITAWRPAGQIEHSKTDVFLQRLQFTGEFGERIKAALLIGKREDALARLQEIEDEVIGLPSDVVQVHTALVGVFLGYREKKGYHRMAALFERFPKELKETAVAREQYALALNRLAEEASERGDTAGAEDLRKRALSCLAAIPKESVTSETYGIRGRIYKGWHDAIRKAAGEAVDPLTDAKLKEAIATYEQGFRADLRDYYPGVNAVTLRLLRGSREDRAAMKTLLPVVRYSVSAAPPPKDDTEKYWQTATKLELATAACDWKDAKRHLTDLLAIQVEEWMRSTTVANLRRQQTAFAGNAKASAEIERIAVAVAP